MNKKLARIFTCLMAFSFALQLSPAAATSNHLDVQDISQNVAPEGDGPETEYPPDFPDERLDPEFEAHFEVEQDSHYRDYLLNADLPEELIARLKMNSEPLEEREYVPPTAEELNQTRVQAESFDCTTVTDVPLEECEALVALYESTNGAGWTDHSNWLVTTTVGNWHGVTVSNGRVMYLNLTANRLSGAIPPELGNLTGLWRLDLSNNQLSGPIPDSLGNTNVHTLRLYNNQLSGAIPDSLGNLDLVYLDLSGNQLSGEIPASLGNATGLMELKLGGNQLSGEIPPELGNLNQLGYLYLNGNQLSGAIPASLGNLNIQKLNLSGNQLSGPIPAGLGYIYTWELNLSCNQLSEGIPVEFGSLTELQVLNLGWNQLSGPIPASLGSLTNLQVLYLGGNQLSEGIPAQLGNLTNLQVLSLFDNQLSGSIPTSLGDLPQLQFLDLWGNQLSGAIPDRLRLLTNLWGLYLGGNQLSGEIPNNLGNLTRLRALYLDSNQLSGSIPGELGNLVNLKSLNLSNNAFSGHVPASFRKLVNLCDPDNDDPPCYGYYDTDLSYNHLNVPAPESLVSFLASKDPDWYLTQAVEEVIQGESGGTLISNDENTEIIIPPDAVNGEVTFLFDPQPTPTHAIDRRLDFAGNSFELTAWDETEQPVTTFAPPLVITISYDEESLGVIPEISLFLYYWDETQAAWLDAATICDNGQYTRNLAENWLSLPICRTGEFALVGGEEYTLYLPLITR